MLLKLDIPIDPVAKGRHRSFYAGYDAMQDRHKIGTFTPEKTKQHEMSLKWFFKAAMKSTAPFDMPLSVCVYFYMPRVKNPKNKVFHIVKPDLSNLLKQVEDAGNGILWKDDSSIVEIFCRKEYADVDGPRIKIEIRGLSDQLRMGIVPLEPVPVLSPAQIVELAQSHHKNPRTEDVAKVPSTQPRQDSSP